MDMYGLSCFYNIYIYIQSQAHVRIELHRDSMSLRWLRACRPFWTQVILGFCCTSSLPSNICQNQWMCAALQVFNPIAGMCQ